ncbi:MAG: hypothetical protein IPP96_04885 [Chitinophagaceae bacterium]|nr:hypothetical protein [Chitinophagaceae bacterium]
MKKKSLFTSLVLAATTLTACSSNEIGDSKDVNQDKIYMDYFISHEEGDENVDVTCQFRFAGNAGTTLVLNDSSNVAFDGEKLKVDSSTTGGAYYSTHKPVSSFYGRHIISFTNTHGKRFDNEFIFSPFTLTGTGKETGRKKDLTITYQSAPLTAADHVEVYSTNTDSSFHFSQPGPDTGLVIPEKELKRQKAKTLAIACKLYREIDLKQSTSEGGSIRIQQELKPVKIKLFP